ASSWHDILIQTLYRPEATPWEDANRMAWFTIKHFSETWGTYPWPHATTVEGLVEGMEYPMLTFVPSIEKREDQYWVLTHEFGHEWFPMMVGSDERRYPWMDEGFNTFIDYGSAEGYFKGTAYGDTVRRELLADYRISAVPGNEQPLITKPVESRDLAWTAYQKPASMLTVLRDAVLGKEAFERALREYVRRWTFKHPQPADFFRTIENVSGRDLDWFWRAWVYTTARLDQAVDSVTVAGDTTLTGARALRQGLGTADLAADVVLVDSARDIRLAAFASLGRPLTVVYCISTPRPSRDLLTRLAFRRVAATVFLTQQLAQSALAEAPFMRRAGHRVIPNGVDCDLFRPDEAAGHAFRRRHALGDGPVLLGVGALEIEKRWDLLRDGVARVAPPAPPLLLCGTGALEAALR